MEEPSGLLSLIIVLIFVSAFFSASETALLSISQAKVRAVQKQKKFGTNLLLWLHAHPKRLIIAILIGVNIVNTLIPVLTTIWASARFGDNIIGAVTGILTLVLILFAEILPKNIGQLYNEKIALLAAPVIYGMVRGLSPIIWIFEKISDFLIRKKNIDPVTEEEVLAMVALGAEGGALEKEERQLIENVLEYTDTTAEEVMTPRIDLEAMDGETTLKEAVNFFIAHSHSRIPVYEDNIDHIIGIITIKQTLKAWEDYEENKLIKNLELKTPIFTSATKKIADLFRDLQRQRLHIAIVVDEHGGTAGIVTMEDILEEVFGEITDETDDIEDTLIRKLSGNSWSVPGGIDLHDLAERTGVMLEEDLEEGKTLSRYILETTEDIPDRGDHVETPIADLVIERMEGRKIDRVRILLKK